MPGGGRWPLACPCPAGTQLLLESSQLRALPYKRPNTMCLFVYLIVFALLSCWQCDGGQRNPLPATAAVTLSQGNTTGVTAVFGN